MSQETSPFECAICLEVCVEPCTASCGKHNFCLDHLREYIRLNQPGPTCPMCRAPIQRTPEEVVVNVGIREALEHSARQALAAAATLAASAAAAGASPLIPFEQIRFETNSRGQWVELGRGSAGTVYAATYLGEAVAVKHVLLPKRDAAAASRLRDMIRQEVLLQYQLRHDHVVAVHGESEDVGDGGTLDAVAIVMQRMHLTLQDWAAPANARPTHDILLRLVDVLRALRFLHARGIVHGDIKPSNAMIDSAGAARLCDFGSARLRRDDLVASSLALLRSAALSTPLYLDPAVFASERSKRKASDVYSFCIMAWELLAGRAPFSGPETASIEALLAHVRVEGNRPDLSALPAVEPRRGRSLDALGAALQRGWAARQEDRPAIAELLPVFEALVREGGEGGDRDGRGLKGGAPAVTAAAEGRARAAQAEKDEDERRAREAAAAAERARAAQATKDEDERKAREAAAAAERARAAQAKKDEDERKARETAAAAERARAERERALRLAPAGMGRRIYDAAWDGDMDALRLLMQEWSGHDVLNWASPSGWTPLIACSFIGKVHAVRLLLVTPGVDVNKASSRGRTAIMNAAAQGHTDVVSVLLAATGIDINKKDEDGKTALGLAIACYKPEAAALLRAAGAEEEQVPQLSPAVAAAAAAIAWAAQAKKDEDGRKAREDSERAARERALRVAPWGTGNRIYDAAKAGDMAALGPLVQEWSGHDVLNYDPNNDGWTPLMIGSAGGKVEAVQLLLVTPGIDVNKACNRRCTAIMTAAFNGHTEVVRALLAAPGIDVNKRDKSGRTALGLAIHWSRPQVVALLRAAGAME